MRGIEYNYLSNHKLS